MAKWAKCDRCGAEVWFDAYVTYNEIVIILLVCFWPNDTAEWIRHFAGK